MKDDTLVKNVFKNGKPSKEIYTRIWIEVISSSENKKSNPESYPTTNREWI